MRGVEDAWNLAECDYYQGLGSCSFGCWEEPSCITDQPVEGWPSLDLHPVEEQNRRARRHAHRMRKWLAWLPSMAHARLVVDKPFPSTQEIVVAMAREADQ